MEFRSLPFEYQARYGDHFKEWGIPLDQAVVLEERDRHLEDFLATQGGGLPIVVAAADASAKSKAAAHYVCDGSSDDVEVRAAIDDAGTGGVVLLVGEHFYLGTTVLISAGVTLSGQSVRYPYIHTTFDGSAFQIQPGCGIEKMLIDTAGYFDGTSNTGAAVEGVELTDGSGWFHVTKVEMVTTGEPGLIVDNSASSRTGNIWITDCPFFRTEAGAYGIELYNVRHAFIQNSSGHSTAGLTGPGTNTGIYIDSDTINVDVIGGDWIGDIDIHGNAVRVIGIDGADACRITLEAASENSIVTACMRINAITDNGTGNIVANNNIGGAAAGVIPDPATTVEAETSYGTSSAVGTDTKYARADHTHGTPALPTPAAIGAAEDDHTHATTSSGEQLVQDGSSAPPVTLTTEAQDDWLYEG